MATIVDLSPSYNKTAIYADGAVLPGDPGIDGGGFAYSGTLLGSSTVISGIPFQFGSPNVLDSAANKFAIGGASSVPLPSGNFSKLWILGTGVSGNQAAQPVSVVYSDSSQDNFTQSFSDWFTPQGYAGEGTAFTLSYRDKNDGTTSAGTLFLYIYSFSLNPAKLTATFNLPGGAPPGNQNVIILAATLIPLPFTGSPTVRGGAQSIYVSDSMIF